jgi:hypothetical protein
MIMDVRIHVENIHHLILRFNQFHAPNTNTKIKNNLTSTCFHKQKHHMFTHIIAQNPNEHMQLFNLPYKKKIMKLNYKFDLNA